ncbi:hypothetical protein [Arcanobacterium hippocoleae]|uniref:hypothetical protein n=1 Tax=Arcanobacterium hippocoleae TaxID=149017 RepID=UPI00334029C6
MRKSFYWRTISLTLTATAIFSMSACAQNTHFPEPVAAGIAEPIVNTGNFAKILSGAKQELNAADAALDANLLGKRINGVMKFQRSGQYQLKKILGDKYLLPAVIIDSDAVPISAGTEFPRITGNVNQPGKTQNFQTLSIWVQENARAPYQLWGQTYLFPDLKIPKLESKLTDTKSILDPAKYVAAPQELVSAYTAYLNSGTPGTPKFNEADPIFTQIKSQREQLTAALGELAQVETPAIASEQGFKMVPTADGGAILSGAIQYNVIVTRAKENATLRLKGEIGALAAQNGANPQVDVKTKLTASYSLLASFYLPPKNAKSKVVQVIGATAPTLISVTNE